MANKDKFRANFISRWIGHNWIFVVAVFSFAAVATFIITTIQAAPKAIEVEGGSLTTNASIVADSSASNGSAVKFSAGSSMAGCANTTPYAPDGPDPWGGCWPGESNTGVPAGVTLTPYTGPCIITTNNTTITDRVVNCAPLVIRAANVTITNVQLNGGVNIESAYCGTASMVIMDSDVDIPAEVTTGNSGSTGILRCNFEANRVNVTGGRRSMYCVSNCVIENSWVHEHGVDPNAEAHFSGIRMEQDGVFRHNSITCEATRSGPGSGCSAGLTGYGDFAAVQNNLIERNLFYRGGAGGSTVCAYGGSSGDDGSKPYGHLAENIRFIGNRFVKGSNGLCGNLRTILDFEPSRPGNVWSDNLYNDGAVVSPNGP